MPTKSDTIFALSSGIGKSAVALIRVSGGECEKILRTICNRSTWTDRKVVYTDIFDNSGALIDKGIILFFKSPRSFTGEDMLEFHVTGGRAVKSALLNALSEFSDTRPAEAGEFARRAFENGKLDLVQVEGLAAIVDAETVAQSRHSALMAFGMVSQQCEKARSELLAASALAEALLDFSDIEDPDGTSVASVLDALRGAKATLEALFRRGLVNEQLREGFAVAFVGTPNAGKSTLINYILQREAAIVSEIPGTTRDYLEFFVELNGFPVVLIDTAGFRVALDPIERLGIERSQDRIRAVDLIVWLSADDDGAVEYLPSGVSLLKVRSKIDLLGARRISTDELSISARTGEGVEALVSKIVDHATVFFSDAGTAGLGTERQRSAASEAICAIDRALLARDQPEEFMAEEIRVALRSVGRITGRVDVEDVLDEVFSRLCVGK